MLGSPDPDGDNPHLGLLDKGVFLVFFVCLKNYSLVVFIMSALSFTR